MKRISAISAPLLVLSIILSACGSAAADPTEATQQYRGKNNIDVRHP